VDPEAIRVELVAPKVTVLLQELVVTKVAVLPQELVVIKGVAVVLREEAAWVAVNAC